MTTEAMEAAGPEEELEEEEGGGEEKEGIPDHKSGSLQLTYGGMPGPLPRGVLLLPLVDKGGDG